MQAIQSLASFTQEITVDSRKIAERCNKLHKINLLEFQEIYFDTQNRQQAQKDMTDYILMYTLNGRK